MRRSADSGAVRGPPNRNISADTAIVVPGSRTSRNEVVGHTRALSSGHIGRRDLDTDRVRRHHRTFCLHGQTDFTCLILSNFDHEFAIGGVRSTSDPKVWVLKAGHIERKSAFRALVQDAHGVIVTYATIG